MRVWATMLSRSCPIIVACMIATGTMESVSHPDYVPGQLIVYTQASSQSGMRAMSVSPYLKLKRLPGVQQIYPLSSSKGIQIQSRSSSQAFLLECDDDMDMEVFSKSVGMESWVEHAEPNYMVRAFGLSKDTHSDKQDYLGHANLSQFWGLSLESDILVAVVDSGVDYTHEDLVDRIVINYREPINGRDDDGNGFIDDRYGYNFYRYSMTGGHHDPMDGFGHGTHIAGIIAGGVNNNRGIAGINPRASILSISFLNSEGWGAQLDAAEAIKYAADRGAKVINCSWGYYKCTRALREAVVYAQSKGAIVVAAAGNDGSNRKEYPAALDHVITVGAINLNHDKSYFSSYGDHVEFFTYGENIYNTVPDQGYQFKSGTSQSAAIVSGGISAMLSYNPKLGYKEILACLVTHSTSFTSKKRDPNLGYGVLSFDVGPSELISVYDSSLDLAISSTSLNLTKVANFPNPFGSEGTKFGFELDQSASIKIHIFSVTGQLVKRIEGLGFSGYNTVSWDGVTEQGDDANNGTYFYLIEAIGDYGTDLFRGKVSVLR